MKTYNVLYDNIREPITLGGILVVRKECEIKVQKGANINFFYKKKINKIEKDLILNAFSSSIYKFRILKLKRKNKKKFINDQNKSEYYSLTDLNKILKKKDINLQWNRHVLKKAKNIRKYFGKNLISIHLKYVKPYRASKSNASIVFWNKFFKKYQARKNLSFLILGHDKIDSKIKNFSNVFWAKKLKIGLSKQLCLISLSDKFIGMASGISGAAMFSNKPYLIFKHQKHHATQMKKELNRNKTFFSKKNQYIVISKPNFKILDNFITNHE